MRIRELGQKITPLGFAGALFAFYLFFNFVQRCGYWIWVAFTPQIQTVGVGELAAFAKGSLFDVITAAFLFLAPLLILILTPQKGFKLRPVRMGFVAITSFALLLMFFLVLCEVFFFAEFHSRFNFIAVDYLVYSHEVVRNAIESYPLFWILFGLFLFWLPFAYAVFKITTKFADQPFPFKSRVVLTILLVCTLCAAHKMSEDQLIEKDSFWGRELAKNTIFTLVAAYQRNAIDFHQFYSTIDSTEATHITHEWLEDSEGVENEFGEDEFSIVRNIKAYTEKKDWNVVLVIIESLSSRFMGQYGNSNGLTPNLDRLANEGLFFQNLYATGTRTVRGLEALMLSIPPTPGQSILRRPKSEGLFNLAAVMNDQGYHSQFIYGGFAYFDNMKNWFESNGFEVVDRSRFQSENIHFANAWGVCDEDLFDQVLREGDRLTAEGKPFFQSILTTSNHRPYTYPDGRIDIPSKTGRNGAVKYTDSAIGRFLEMAKSKSWFKKTLFVFVADHDASVAGGSDIPIQDYLIPMIFYNPSLVPSQKVDKLASQIDFAPTLLGLLGVSYQSRFYGQNLLKAKAGRALLGTYQKISLLEPGHMTILAPGHIVESQTLDKSGRVLRSEIVTRPDELSLTPEAKRTISIYQSASELFTSGRAKRDLKFPKWINTRRF